MNDSENTQSKNETIRARSCPSCHSLGHPADGCTDTWHSAFANFVTEYDVKQLEARLAASRKTREGRCPDGGYCHGETLAAGSPPCAEGTCLRVHTSGPLSGVFPGDRWPEEVLAANSIRTLQILEKTLLPDGTPLLQAIRQASELKSRLQDAMIAPGREDAAAHLQVAAQLSHQVAELITEACRNITESGQDDNELDRRIDAVVALARQPVAPRGEEITRERWLVKLRAAVAQVFLLGMGAGWDKRVGAEEGERKTVTVDLPDGSS